MRKFRIPDLDITGTWVVAVGVFFHLIARLVRRQPEMAVQLGEVFGIAMMIFGGYRIINVLIEEAEKEEKDRENHPE
ncbi:MAG: type-F conjugative transfer system pilin chaperone TraQ [Enterobacter sichuanensis]|uniref:type-F conjugative transfer system pilin chaperone TraQ n=1 Tax=Enterobacteriaceae TaxID=543 RepID=UPI0004645CC8|nr:MULTISPECIES: type-F conjugative transfer system pilin chaperone TraQ [Enterobacter cloacae complex]QBB08621.1 conjugal transfer protein TraQ [Enterobacter cloacae]HCL5492629.1 type-F conjugative transfer system pilin chaperone TraQ [Citrobacter freundii]HCM6637640.1 type-F conjugative transfer system pilin chaperone TraQ [Klebsiella pneumoniae]MCE1344500.1 type-F conjugative transfer system pilin chaperone TraQ [Enterobacter asburiae]MDU5196198.1 type-F conjugative transfer system pilin ch